MVYQQVVEWGMARVGLGPVGSLVEGGQRLFVVPDVMSSVMSPLRFVIIDTHATSSRTRWKAPGGRRSASHGTPPPVTRIVQDLVRAPGDMVHGTCLHLRPRSADVDDAVQAAPRSSRQLGRAASMWARGAWLRTAPRAPPSTAKSPASALGRESRQAQMPAPLPDRRRTVDDEGAGGILDASRSWQPRDRENGCLSSCFFLSQTQQQIATRKGVAGRGAEAPRRNPRSAA